MKRCPRSAVITLQRRLPARSAIRAGTLSLVMVACLQALPASAAAPALGSPATSPSPKGGAGSAVNPLTGQTSAFEATQRRLEQMRLETLLLEEEAKQTNIRNSMTLAPIRRTSEERRLQAEMFGPAGIPAALPGPVALPTRAPAAPARRPPQVRAAAPPPHVEAATAPPVPVIVAPAGPQVMAILRSGDKRRAIVQIGTTTMTVSDGDAFMGRVIGPITDNSVSVDGVVVDLPRTPAVLAVVDRRPPPGQPVMVNAPRDAPGAMRPSGALSVASPPRPAAASSPVAFPPLPPLASVPLIAPVDPANPLSVLGPRPSLPPASSQTALPAASPLPPPPAPAPARAIGVPR